MNWYDKEEQALEDQLDRGEITQVEFNAEMRSLRDELKGQAEEAAERAYDDCVGGW